MNKEKSIKYILFINKNNDFSEYKTYFNYLKDNKYSIKIFYLDNLKDLFDLLLNYLCFKIIIVIISQELYPEYYNKLKIVKPFIKCLPICIILSSDKEKELLSINKKIKKFTKEIKNSISDSFYNFGGIGNLDNCRIFIDNLYKQSFFEYQQNNDVNSKENFLIFEIVESDSAKILFFLYNRIMFEEKIEENEISSFLNFLKENHKEKNFLELINPLILVKNIPHEIIIKFLIRAYTENNSFSYKMNKSLLDLKGKEYKIFIKLIFENVVNKSLLNTDADYLYYGTKSKRDKIDKIIKSFLDWKDNDFVEKEPLSFIYSRCFISFTKDENNAQKNIGETDNDYYGVLFKYNNKYKIFNQKYTNIDIEEFSSFPNEKEVLFFPYTIFHLKNIYKGESKDKKCIIIELDDIESYINTNKFCFYKDYITDYFLEYFNDSNYSNDIIDSGILNGNQTEILEKMKNLLEEEHGIKINENYFYRHLFAMCDPIIFNGDIKIDKNKEFDEIEINEDLINSIHKNNNKKSHYQILNSIKQNKTKYIWKGSYNDDNKKNGIGKEYDLDNNLIYEGEYENGIKKKGIEYYIIGTKKFEGNYKNGIRWNGFLYDLNMKNKYELKNGNGYIKEYHENGCLLFEGEIKDGNKNGKGKIYDKCGHLIFDGEFNNNIKYGKGKVYNYCGDLVFDGEFKNGEKMDGDIYTYNNKCELITIKNGNINNSYKSINNYTNHLMIGNCIWIMKNKEDKKNKKLSKLEKLEKSYINEIDDSFIKEKDNNNNYIEKSINNINKENIIYVGHYKNGIKHGYGREYNIWGNLKFSGNYNNGKKVRGREYDYYGEIIFQGEYKDECYYNGLILNSINYFEYLPDKEFYIHHQHNIFE